MRHLWLVLGIASLVTVAAAPLRAQGKFPLKYVDAPPNDPLVSGGHPAWPALPSAPLELKVPPKDTAGGIRYFLILAGEKRLLAALVGSRPQRLYVDAAGSGDLSKAQPLAESGKEGAPTFGPVAFSSGEQFQFCALAGSRLLTVLPAGYRTGEMTPRGGQAFPVALLEDSAGLHILMVTPAACMAGEVTLGGRVYRVALRMDTVSGRYDKALTLPAEPPGLRPPCTTFAIDLNQDGTFDNDIRESGEAAPLAPMIEVRGVYYSVNVAPDGTSVRIKKAEPKMGTLDIDCADMTMIVFSDSGWHRLQGSGGKWQVPAGRYTAYGVTICRTDASGAGPRGPMNRREDLKRKTLARRRRQNRGVPGLKGLDRTEKPSLAPRA
jgi:hypothetical protein